MSFRRRVEVVRGYIVWTWNSMFGFEFEFLRVRIFRVFSRGVRSSFLLEVVSMGIVLWA